MGNPCRRKRGILYENPVLIFDDGTEQPEQYMYNGFRIVPVSSLPRIQADPIGFENLEKQNNHFLSGESYIATSMQDNSATQPGFNQAMPRIFLGSILSNLFSAVSSKSDAMTTTTVVEQLLTTTSTSFSSFAKTVTLGCIPYSCRIPHVYEFVYLHLYYNIPTTKMGKNDIV